MAVPVSEDEWEELYLIGGSIGPQQDQMYVADVEDILATIVVTGIRPRVELEVPPACHILFENHDSLATRCCCSVDNSN